MGRVDTVKGLEEHKYLIGDRTMLPCPFCGVEPYIDSCDRIINIGCEQCGYHRYFPGLVQSDHVTNVVASKYKQTGEPFEWYEKDAYALAIDAWNRRADNGTV